MRTQFNIYVLIVCFVVRWVLLSTHNNRMLDSWTGLWLLIAYSYQRPSWTISFSRKCLKRTFFVAPIIIVIPVLWIESLNSDGQQLHRCQQTNNHLTPQTIDHKKDYDKWDWTSSSWIEIGTPKNVRFIWSKGRAGSFIWPFLTYVFQRRRLKCEMFTNVLFSIILHTGEQRDDRPLTTRTHVYFRLYELKLIWYTRCQYYHALLINIDS